MICFRDMTYCSADCETFTCFRNRKQHDADRERLKTLECLPTALADLSGNCGLYKPAQQQPIDSDPPEAA